MNRESITFVTLRLLDSVVIRNRGQWEKNMRASCDWFTANVRVD